MDQYLNIHGSNKLLSIYTTLRKAGLPYTAKNLGGLFRWLLGTKNIQLTMNIM
jgi:hypothetical protein